jgi:hypothetical protein
MIGAADDFEALVHHVSSSYAGYHDKTNGRLESLNRLTASVRARFQAAGSPVERTALFREWLDFFADGHMGLISRSEPNAGVSLAPSDRREELQLTELNRETLVLRVPTFAPSLTEPLNRLLTTHERDLRAHRYLIIDLRGNGGGADYVFHGLIPYLYTRPIELPGADFRASTENAQHVRAFLQRGEVPEEVRNALRSIAELMEASPDTMIPGVPNQTIELPEVLSTPERVVILTDRACVSSAEQFLLIAKQSDKVILMGQNTRGCLDYSNLREIELPSGRYVLRLPMSRSRRLPDHGVDGHGIDPDVRISELEADPIAFAYNYLVHSQNG